MTDDDGDDFDDKVTPGHGTGAGHTPKSWRMSDAERERHRRKWASGVPVVRPEPADEVTAPIELLLNGQLDVDDYAQVEALRRSADDVYVLMLNLARAISRHRDKEKSGQKEIEKQVVAAIDKQARQMADLSAQVADVAGRNASVEGTIKSVKGIGWKAAVAVVTALVGSAAAIIATLQAKAERDGIMIERVLTIQRDIAELKAARISTDHRRDYDYDITPRPLPQKKEP